MRYWPKLFLLATLLLAAARWVSDAGAPDRTLLPAVQTPPRPPAAEITAAAQTGASFEFKPSEQIVADRGVDFPSDI